ncbi:helix-turn-helix domain-containing protein [Microbacterium laevaniformans]|uniref:helix-turn-helix domain-containing protein n=1 Tax=Microbacterium laevaniformans TaxID=36807 RepID=UPI00362C4F8C
MAHNQDSSSPTTVGARLKGYRKLAKLSAEQLADLAGLTRSVVANIENNRRSDITVTELIALSRALDIPPLALMLPLERPFDQQVVGRWSYNVGGLAQLFRSGSTASSTGASARAEAVLRTSASLYTAASRVMDARQEIFHVARAWGFQSQMDELAAALDSGESFSWAIASSLSRRIGRETKDRADEVDALFRAHDVAVADYHSFALALAEISGERQPPLPSATTLAGPHGEHQTET